MPTLQDLAELLTERAESTAPDQHAVIARLEDAVGAGRSPMRRVPWLAAAAVVALAAGVVALAGSSNRGGAPAASVAMPPRGHIVWQFEIGKVPGWTVERTYSSWWSNPIGTAGGWGQGAELTPTSGRGHVSYGREPAAEPFPGNFSTAHPITVAGQPGLWMPGHRVDTADLVTTVRKHPWEAVAASGDPQPQLRWKNADGSWNIVMGTVGFRPATYDFDNVVAKRELLRIAAAVTAPRAVQYVAAPFHVAVGDAFRPSDVNTTRGISCVGWTTIRGAHSPNLPQSLVTVCRAPAGRIGDPIVPRAHALRRVIGDGTVLVVSADRHVLSAAAERRILNSANVSPSLRDEVTWLRV